jgi:RNA methyltransferase, TrmH family
MDNITSIKDPKIVLARDLGSTAGRRRHNKFLIEGEENLKWAVESAININYIICDEKSSELFLHIKKFIPTFYVSSGILKKVTDTSYLIPIVAVADIPEAKDQSPDFVLILDALKDMGNVGTIVRTGMAFGIDSFLATGSSFDPYYKKTIDSSRGLVFSSNFDLYENDELLIKKVKEKGYQIITTSPYGETIQSLVELDDRPIALVIGNETNGVSKKYLEAADKIIQIPMQPNVESLNVGVAAGISIYELKLKQILNMLESKIKSTLGRQVNVLAQFIKKVFDEELKKITNLGANRVVFLMVLQCDKKMSFDQIARENGILASELKDFLEPLQKDKYVQIEDGFALITSEAEDFLSKIWPIREIAEEKILNALSESEKEFFNDIINKLQNRCKELLNL